MASTLIVEDGTGLPDASSYTSAKALRDYATARGVDLAPANGAGDMLVDQMAIKAMDYIERNRSRFYGQRYRQEQRLSFPRTGVPAETQQAFVGIANGYENLTYAGQQYRPHTPLPYELAEAQCQLVLQVKAGVDLMPTQVSGQFVVREKLGPLETQYSEAVGIYNLPQMPMVDALLDVLIKPSGVVTAFRR